MCRGLVLTARNDDQLSDCNGGSNGFGQIVMILRARAAHVTIVLAALVAP